MNLILRIRNKIYYAIIIRLRNRALKNMGYHIRNDIDKSKYWADRAISYNKILYKLEPIE